jgi:hypothetical protein
MSEINERLIAEATRYVEELHWALTFVKGTGDDAKAPLFLGWPDFRPDSLHVRTILEFNAEAQIGINLGASMVLKASHCLTIFVVGKSFPAGKHPVASTDCFKQMIQFFS